jgi:sugar phosphate isomerase/epimerase
MSENRNNCPKLHNATWPGVVGRGDGGEPPISLDRMLDMTASAEVDGQKFDGFDLFLCLPHLDIDASDEDLRVLTEKAQTRNLEIGTLVAPVWPPTGGGSSIGNEADRKKFCEQVKKSCIIGEKLRNMGIRPNGAIRIDSAVDLTTWSEDPKGNLKKMAQTFREASYIADDFGERLVAEGEICWGGMHSWRNMVQLLEEVDRPGVLGFQADMAHTLLYLLGYNAPEDRILPEDFDWDDSQTLQEGLKQLTDALRPWTIDLHIAQNDGTVKGAGNHDKTGRHCTADDPNGKLDIVRDSAGWLRDDSGEPTRVIRHICWDGCMFPDSVMMQDQTWEAILGKMIEVRDAHGWYES